MKVLEFISICLVLYILLVFFKFLLIACHRLTLLIVISISIVSVIVIISLTSYLLFYRSCSLFNVIRNQGTVKLTSNHQFSKHFLEQLNNLRCQNLLCDVQIKVGYFLTLLLYLIDLSVVSIVLKRWHLPNKFILYYLANHIL